MQRSLQLPGTHVPYKHAYRKMGALLSVVRAPAAFPSSLSLWFILPDGSAHPSNPDCGESRESSSSGGSEPEPAGRQLFCLDYEADSGEVTSVIVYQVRLAETAAA